MIGKQETDSVIICYALHHQTMNNKSEHSLIRPKRFENVIHTTDELPRNDRLTNGDLGWNLSNIDNKSIDRLSNSVPNHQQRKNQSLDRTVMTNDNHYKAIQKKKTNKCTIECFILPLVITLGIIAVVVPVLLALLLKHETKSTPSGTPVLRWNTTGITVAGMSGTAGNGNNQLNTPLDIVLDWANNLYIADSENHRIQKYSFNSIVGHTVAGNGINGTSPSQLYRPGRLLVTDSGDIYVSDTYNHRIQLWENGAANGTTIAGVTGVLGSTYDKLNLPYGIALHPTTNTLYIAEYWNHRVMSYAPGAKNGTLVCGGNGPGLNNTQLRNPIGLYYDSFSNNIFIANFYYSMIVRYVLGATSWTLAAGNSNGTLGTDSMHLFVPTDVTFDPMGNMYVADRNNFRIQFFSVGSMIGTTIAGVSGSFGSTATRLNTPWAMRLDSQLNLYVADTINHRIQKFLRY